MSEADDYYDGAMQRARLAEARVRDMEAKMAQWKEEARHGEWHYFYPGATCANHGGRYATIDTTDMDGRGNDNWCSDRFDCPNCKQSITVISTRRKSDGV